MLTGIAGIFLIAVGFVKKGFLSGLLRSYILPISVKTIDLR